MIQTLTSIAMGLAIAWIILIIVSGMKTSTYQRCNLKPGSVSDEDVNTNLALVGTGLETVMPTQPTSVMDSIPEAAGSTPASTMSPGMYMAPISMDASPQPMPSPPDSMMMAPSTPQSPAPITMVPASPQPSAPITMVPAPPQPTPPLSMMDTSPQPMGGSTMALSPQTFTPQPSPSS